MIIDLGNDRLDPIDPVAGMDLGEVKAKYGQRVALKGNVDCAQLMTFGTPEEVIAATKEALRKECPAVVLSSHPATPSIPLLNLRIMLPCCRRCTNMGDINRTC